MNNSCFTSIYNRELSIYANIRFDSQQKEKLDKIMDIIAPNSRKECLSNKDIIFSYCKERNVWYGSKSFNEKKYINIREL